MAAIRRVTASTLDVLEELLHAYVEGRRMHGWEIKKATGLSGPTVYGVIDRLDDAGWIEGEWEQQSPGENRPRRRLYSLQGTAVATARALLAERRPDDIRGRRVVSHPALPGLGGAR